MRFSRLSTCPLERGSHGNEVTECLKFGHLMYNTCYLYCFKRQGGGGGEIRLIVGFQPLMVISPTASWIRWCMKVYAWWFAIRVGETDVKSSPGVKLLGMTWDRHLSFKKQISVKSKAASFAVFNLNKIRMHISKENALKLATVPLCFHTWTAATVCLCASSLINVFKISRQNSFWIDHSFKFYGCLEGVAHPSCECAYRV